MKMYQKDQEVEMLRPQELASGMPVTVVDGPDRSYRGDVLRVVAVDLPFVALRHPEYRQRLVLDTREWGFKALSAEFVAAIEAPEPTGDEDGSDV